jgi:hypothetical protein
VCICCIIITITIETRLVNFIPKLGGGHVFL